MTAIVAFGTAFASVVAGYWLWPAIQIEVAFIVLPTILLAFKLL